MKPRSLLRKCRQVLLVFLGISSFTISGISRSQEIIPLTVIDAYAPTALWVRVFMNYYMPEVDRRLETTGNYEIDW
ncbi:MAG: hypothetical protein MK009_03020, partial [Gammaproteobacteria bacterium]|nr:hypothetical protein [Gammaproteobacteria bacterium]